MKVTVGALSGSGAASGLSGLEQKATLISTTIDPGNGISDRKVRFAFANSDGDSVLVEFTVTKQSGAPRVESLWPFEGNSNVTITVEGEEV